MTAIFWADEADYLYAQVIIMKLSGFMIELSRPPQRRRIMEQQRPSFYVILADMKKPLNLLARPWK